jgi:hypothetical protein
VGKGPDQTIIIGQGTQSAVVKFLPGGDYGRPGGEVHNLKIKPAPNQDGVYFQFVVVPPIPIPIPEEMVVQNSIIKGGRRGIVIDGPGTADVLNSAILMTTSHAIEVQNGAQARAWDNLIGWNQGSAFYPNGTPTYYQANYNDMWRNGNNNQSDLPPEGNNLFVDPKIANQTTFTLRSTSPLIGAGQLAIPVIPLVAPIPPPVYAPVDIGAYGKIDKTPPEPPLMTMADREYTRVDMDWVDSPTPNMYYYIVYRAPSPSGPWTFSHSCEFGWWMDPFCIVMYEPTPPMPWLKMVSMDTSFNFSVDSNAVSPPTQPQPGPRWVYRDSTHCIGVYGWDVKFQMIPPSQPQVGGAIHKYEIYHCWRKEGTNCDYPPTFVNPAPDNWYYVYASCDSLAHYFTFRGQEKAGPPGKERYSYSLYSIPFRVCMVSPDTCIDKPMLQSMVPLPSSTTNMSINENMSRVPISAPIITNVQITPRYTDT